jgi:hypothetical protein
LFEAELALVTSNRDKVRILERYVDYCNKTWTEVSARMNSGLLGGGSADESRARAARLEAEIRLNEFHAAMDAAAPEAIKTQNTSASAEGQKLAALLKLESLKIEPGDDELQKLFKERYNAALRAVKLYQYQYEAGTARAAPLCASARELCEAELAFVSRPTDQIRILEQYVDQCNKLWKQAEAKLIAGGVTGFIPVDEADARAARYEAEIKLLRLRNMRPIPLGDSPVGVGPRSGLVPSGMAPLPALLTAELIEASPFDDPAVKELKERYNVALFELRAVRKQTDASAVLRIVTTSGPQLLLADLAVGKDKDLAYERFIELMKYFESFGIAMPDGSIEFYRFNAIREARQQAELKRLELRKSHDRRVNAPTTGDAVIPSVVPSPLVFNVKPKDAPKEAPALLFAAQFKPEPGDDEWRKLLKEKYNAAASAMQYYRTQFDSGMLTPLGDLLVAGRNVRDAELAFDSDPRQQLPILEAYLQFTKYLADIAHARLVAGGSVADAPVEAARMREARADAELQVLHLRGLLERRNDQPKPATSKESVKAPSAARDTALPAVSPNVDATRTPSSATSARPDGAESFAGPAPDIHNASGPLNLSGKSLADLVKIDDQKPQPGASAQRKQLMLRYNDALRSVKSEVNRFGQGKTSAKLLCNSAREFTDARLALFEDPFERVPIANWDYVFALRTWKETEAKLHAGGNTPENRDDEAAAREAIFDARSKYDTILAALPVLMWSKIVQISPNDDERQKLLKERYNAALRALRGSYVRHRVDSNVPFTDVIAAARQVLPAGSALQTQPEGRLRAHEHYLELMKYLEKEAEALRKAQLLAQHELDTAREARVDAEIKLFDARQSGVGQQPPSAQGAAEAPHPMEAIVSSSAAESRRAPANRPRSNPLPAWLTAEPLKVSPSDDDHKKLLKQRYNAALQSLKAAQEHQKLHPTVSAFTDVFPIARQLLAADVALHKSGDVIPSYERYFELLKCLDDTMTWLRKDGMGINAATYEAVHAARLDAEVKLLDVKGGTAPAPVRARASGKK